MVAQISRKEKEDDQDDEKDADHERDFDVVHAGANGGGAIDCHVHLDGGRDFGLKARHLLEDSIDRIDDVGAGNFEDDDQNRIFKFPGMAGGVVARKTRGVNVRDRVDHGAEVADADGGSSLLVIADDDRLRSRPP